MSVYLDASVLVPLFVWEPRTTVIRQWVEMLTVRPIVGRLAVIEVGSAISRKRRQNELDEPQGAQALAAADEWLDAAADVVEHEAADLAGAELLVRRPIPKLLPADAIHLATARRLGLSLTTDDDGLKEVATLLRIGWLSPA